MSHRWDTNPRPDDYEVFHGKWLPETRRLLVYGFHLADGWGNHVVGGCCDIVRIFDNIQIEPMYITREDIDIKKDVRRKNIK